jgi:hypothetical protein
VEAAPTPQHGLIRAAAPTFGMTPRCHIPPTGAVRSFTEALGYMQFRSFSAVAIGADGPRPNVTVVVARPDDDVTHNRAHSAAWTTEPTHKPAPACSTPRTRADATGPRRQAAKARPASAPKQDRNPVWPSGVRPSRGAARNRAMQSIVVSNCVAAVC